MGIKNPLQANYHVQRSLEAICKGEWIGVGIGRSSTKLTGLPFPPTDSIFAVIVEELGLVGGTFLVGLYGILLWRGIRIANHAPDLLGMLLAAGLTFWIIIEATINMGMMVGILPFAGNALPFISAGGSNLLSMLAAIGILMNISRQSRVINTDIDWRNTSARVDLRRRNGRRGVSRTNRSGRDEQ
jgi:cell division protein FtsW